MLQGNTRFAFNVSTYRVIVFARGYSRKDNYLLLLVLSASVEARISFDFLRGVAAKDYDEMAKLEHLRPIEVSLYWHPIILCVFCVLFGVWCLQCLVPYSADAGHNGRNQGRNVPCPSPRGGASATQRYLFRPF